MQRRWCIWTDSRHACYVDHEIRVLVPGIGMQPPMSPAPAAAAAAPAVVVKVDAEDDIDAEAEKEAQATYGIPIGY